MDNINTFDKEQYLNMELLRFSTAGSVDDGKSTLIGRLLYDSKAIFQDQMDNLEEVSKLRGEEGVNLALLTDGLRAEREQGITIDVAYRYFSTPKRKFIIADTPGHEQYTRNMVTGASTADLAIILIDARNGVLTQSRRHGIISSLLNIPHVIVAINKMDVVDYSEDVYNEIVNEYTDFSKKLNIKDLTFIPISALLGDNVVIPSKNMDWYDGPTIMHQLENVVISADKNHVDFRFPVQYVVRPHQDFRGFSGRISSGSIKVEEPVTILPSKKRTKIKEIVSYNGNMVEAHVGDSVVLTLEDEIDISRGDMIVRDHNVPTVSRKLDATICWMDDEKHMNINCPYILQQTTRNVKAFVKTLNYQLDVNTLHRSNALTLKLNEIGRVEIETASPIFIDSYNDNRDTGSFILIDPATNQTVASGMIRHSKSPIEEEVEKTTVSSNVKWEDFQITREMREKRNGHQGHCFWFTGLSGSGKSTIAKELEKQLFEQGKQVFVLDGDNIRHGLSGDLGFSDEDREENLRRVAHVAKLMYETGHIVICSFISPTYESREYARKLFPENSFSEIYVKCNLEICIKRDPKGLYERVKNGEIKNFTGIDSTFNEPVNPEIVIDTSNDVLISCVDKIVSYSEGIE